MAVFTSALCYLTSSCCKRGHYYHKLVKTEVEVFQRGDTPYICTTFYCIFSSCFCIVYMENVSYLMVMLSCVVCRYWGTLLRLVGLAPSVANLHISTRPSRLPAKFLGSVQTPVLPANVILGIRCNVKGSESLFWGTDVPPHHHTLTHTSISFLQIFSMLV